MLCGVVGGVRPPSCLHGVGARPPHSTWQQPSLLHCQRTLPLSPISSPPASAPVKLPRRPHGAMRLAAAAAQGSGGPAGHNGTHAPDMQQQQQGGAAGGSAGPAAAQPGLRVATKLVHNSTSVKVGPPWSVRGAHDLGACWAWGGVYNLGVCRAMHKVGVCRAWGGVHMVSVCRAYGGVHMVGWADCACAGGDRKSVV